MSIVVGIDLGIRKIAVACFEQELYHTATFEAREDHPRDVQLREVASYAHDVVGMAGARSVWIEDVIIGNNRKYSLQLAKTLGAVLSHLAQMRGTGVDIRTVDNKAWKKEVLGNGNADKDTIKNYINVTHPAYAPLCGDDQDLYDATCVGLYGRIIIERAHDMQSGLLVGADGPGDS